jgi:hypothetical protein
MWRERSKVEMPARSAKVAKIVDPTRRLDAGGELCRLPLAVAEVVQVEIATMLGREEQRAVRVRRLALERVDRDRL